MQKAVIKLWEVIKEFIYIINTPINTISMRNTNYKLLIRVNLVICVLTVLLAIMDIATGKTKLLICVISVFIGCILAVLAVTIFNRRIYLLVIDGIVLGGVLTYTFLSGANNGNVAIWILFVPIITMSITELPYGIGASVYFFVLVTVTFYTPIKNNIPYRYNDTFAFKFPIIYLAAFLLGIVINVQLKKYQMKQLEYQNNLEDAVNSERARVEKISMEIVASISNAVEAKDNYTRQHSIRVANYSREIAKRYGCDEKQQEDIYTIGLLHDIGKIGIPDNILNKPEKLTDDEYQIMKKHVLLGADILKDFTTIPGMDVGAKYHHEKYDGSGYPEGLKGDNIPFEARIISIADTIDAMNSNRVYREHCNDIDIVTELEKGAGKQFDEKLTLIALQLIKEGKMY